MTMNEHLYKPWGIVRQSAVKAGLAAEKAAYKLTGGKAPAELFSYRAEPEKIETNVRIVREDSYSTDIAKFDGSGKMTDEPFKILSTTDFHFDEDPELNYKTVKLFIQQIKDNKPDLVILTGDVIQSKYQQFDAIKFGEMMEETGVYWTACFGNHETREEKGFYKWLLLKSFADFDHCLVKHGPAGLFGYGNHTVNILGKGGRIRETIFLFDSGRDIRDYLRDDYPDLPADAEGYDFLKKEQIAFYKNELDSLKNKFGVMPDSMMFMHIPLCEYKEVFNQNEDGTYSPSGKADLLYGEQYESVGCSCYNSGMFDAILEKGSTKAVFAGHDHVNDWCALYKGVYLVYSLPGNYSPYHLGTNFDKPESEWVQGVTITVIGEDGKITIHPDYNRKYLNGGKI